MNDLEKFLTFCGCALVFGTIAYYLSEDHQDERVPRRRTLIKDRTGARDLSESGSANKYTEKEFSPNFSARAVSTMSRSSNSSLKSKDLTSRNTGNWMIPSNNLVIRKYPENYYTLSKKAKWKFRRNSKNPKAA